MWPNPQSRPSRAAARRTPSIRDHPDTLRSATNLAANLRELGEIHAARDLDQNTLDRRRQVLGEDRPDTMSSAANLSADLRFLGEMDDNP